MNSSTRLETIVAITLVVLLLGVGSALTEVRDPTPDLRASTFVNDRGGLRGLFLLLEELDIDTERLLAPVAADDPTDRTVVLAGPTKPFLPAETEQLLAWVERGGRLLVVNQPDALPTHRTYTADLLLRCGYREGRFLEHQRPLGQGVTEFLPRDYEDLYLPFRRRFHEQDPETLEPHEAPRDARVGAPITVFEMRRVPLVVSLPFGAGEIVLVSDSVGFENDGIGRGQNALLAVDLVTGGTEPRAQVRFDEYHHGFSPEGEQPQLYGVLLGRLRTSWTGRAILVALLGVLVYVAGTTVRFGAPLRRLRRGGRPLTEHTDALGRLYENARARRKALRLLASGARRAVGPRVGLSPRMQHLEFDRRLAASPAPGASELAHALVAAQGAGDVSEIQFARLAQELARSKRRFIHGRV